MTTYSMTSTHTILLGLLRVSLGNGLLGSLPSAVFWEDVFTLAEKQGVAHLALDGLQNLPRNVWPGIETWVEWAGQTASAEAHYRQQEDTLRKLSECLVQHNARMLVLKGWGCSLNYPIPSHRPCGDIDIYLIDSNGVDMERELGVSADRSNPHHGVFQYNGFTIENHKTILDVNKHQSNLYIEELLELLAKDSIESAIKNVFVPSSKFNSVHLLRHMASDFATSHTTMRHVLDWATFVNANDVDWSFVHDVAKKTNMSRFLDALNGICVEYLGYDIEKFPVLMHDEALRDRVLNDILDPSDRLNPVLSGRDAGIFEKIAYGIAKTRRMIANRWKYQIVYDETLWESFVGLATNRLKH